MRREGRKKGDKMESREKGKRKETRREDKEKGNQGMKRDLKEK